MNTQAHQAYQKNSIETATPGELTLMLYNGCIKFIKRSKLDIENNNIESKNTNIQKAINIINELIVNLNMAYEVSKEMLPLYEYIRHQLIQANIKNDVDMLTEAQGLVEEFRDTWKEVIKLNRQREFTSGNA